MSNPFQTPEFPGASPMPHRQTLKLKRVGVLSAGLFGGVAGISAGIEVEFSTD